MFRSHTPKVGLVVAGATALVVAAAGLTYAATALSTTKVVYACANAKGTLRLLTKGHCSSGYSKVAINKQGVAGPRGSQGPAGPGAVAVESETSSVTTDPRDVAIPGLGLTMEAVCEADPNGGGGVYLRDTGGSSAYDVTGSDNLLTTGGGHAFLVDNGAPESNLPSGMAPIEYTQPADLGVNSEFVAQLSAGGTAELTADVMVTRGARTALLHVHLDETATHCVAQGWATPTA